MINSAKKTTAAGLGAENRRERQQCREKAELNSEGTGIDGG